MVTATDIDNLERMDHNNNQNRRMVNDAMWCITIGILHMMTNYAMSYSTSYATVNKESIKTNKDNHHPQQKPTKLLEREKNN